MSPLLLAFVVALFSVRYLARPGAGGLDHPGERSLHTRPTPRTGGLGVWAGAACGLLLLGGTLPPGAVPVAGGALALAAVSLADDLRPLAARWRLLVHLLAAAALLPAGLAASGPWLPGLPALPGAAAGVVTVVGVVWMINLYNFMDGMDGFAGGMAVIGFAAFALLGALAGHSPFTLAAATVAAAAAGFLIWNFPPARIFLGDVGSTLFGFLAAVFTLWAAREQIFPIYIGLMVFLPFVADATVTLLRRLLAGEPVWKPHRSHYYQRLVLLGWGHRRTVLTEYWLMLLCATAAVIASTLTETGQALLLAGLVAAAALLMGAVGRLERRAAAGAGRSTPAASAPEK